MANNFLNVAPSIDNYILQDDDEIDLKALLAVLLENKGLILLVTALAFLIGLVKITIETPIYQADGMLQVESSQSLMTMDPLAGMMNSFTPVQAEMEIIKSRMVMGATVKKLSLDVVAQAKYFPFLGKAIARRFKAANQNKLAAPLFGYTEYAWGGEEIKVDTLELPNSWIDKPLTLVAGKNGQFSLFDSNETLIATGTVGKPVIKAVAGEDAPLAIFVSVLEARPGTHFTVIRRSLMSAINDVRRSFSVSEKGRDIGILSFTMTSASPAMAMQTLNEVVNIYVRMNVEKKSAEAQKTLEFLEEQLPLINNQLETATAALNEYRLKKGSVNLDIEMQGILSGIVEKNTQITLLEQKKDELRRSFTSSHPAVVSIDKQISRLKRQVEKNNKKVSELPETQQIILKLSRDVQVNAELYTTMLNNLQTIKVAKAGTVGDVSEIDYAVLPTEPVKPKKS